MIRIGYNDTDKTAVVEQYIQDHGIKKVFVVSPERFAPPFAATPVSHPDQVDGRRGVHIRWPEHIEYRYYYRVIEGCGPDSLLVLNEVLRTQQRNVLNYNCLRTFLRHTKHRIIFQRMPVIDSIDDFMTLVDFDTRSQWWDKPFDQSMLSDIDLDVRPLAPKLERVDVAITAKDAAAYAKERAALLAEVRGDIDKDPHIIPRNLLLVSGKAKLAHVDPTKQYVGRNNRFKLPNFATYKDVVSSERRTVFELPHNVLDLCDLLAVTGQTDVDVLVANTKADEWYWQRFVAWQKRVSNAYAAIHR